jgi:hypothetical protein
VARAISGNIFKNQGSSWKFEDCRIIVEKDRSLNEKVAGIFGLEIFLMEKGTNSVHGS